ncbi:hypothetical protein H0H92_011919, partial [Tricholoma furcatifolium]
VTGVNGFVGSNVAIALLKAGYEVRGTLRGDKVQHFRDTISHRFSALEVVQVDDLTTADLVDVLKDVDAIVHVAVPIPSAGLSAKENLNIAIEGYLNVLRQAVEANISKVVITGSWSATIDSLGLIKGHTMQWPLLKFLKAMSTPRTVPINLMISRDLSNESAKFVDWGSETEEEFLSGVHNDNPMWFYCAAKALGERAAWKFANENPSLDVSIIIPPFIFGPYAPGFPTPGKSVMSTNQHIYALLTGTLPPPIPPLFCDVRDVAQAHVAALSVSRAASNVEHKRFLVYGGTLIWKDAVQYLHE